MYGLYDFVVRPVRDDVYIQDFVDPVVVLRPHLDDYIVGQAVEGFDEVCFCHVRGI